WDVKLLDGFFVKFSVVVFGSCMVFVGLFNLVDCVDLFVYFVGVIKK
ncbi:cytochrome c family protein, partial [Enterococcus hirae]